MKKILAAFFLFIFVSVAYSQVSIDVHDRDALIIGKKIWMNEAQQRIEWLTWWNKGEHFASIGIGHFIWYPKGVNGPFHEMFPQFLRYAEQHGAHLPTWLRDTPPCPWDSRAAFISAQKTSRMISLRQFLANTVDLQAQFIIYNFNQAIPNVLNNVSGIKRKHVEQQLNYMLATHGGNYALVDYANFKGLGIYSSERYQGQGWGLLQVLEKMQAHHSGPMALNAFVDSARIILQARVANAPIARHELKWLPGWLKRVNTYRGHS